MGLGTGPGRGGGGGSGGGGSGDGGCGLGCGVGDCWLGVVMAFVPPASKTHLRAIRSILLDNIFPIASCSL